MVTLIALGAACFFGAADFVGGVASRRAPSLVAATWVNAVALVILAVPYAALRRHLSPAEYAGAVGGGLLAAVTLNLIYAAFAAGAMSLAAPIVACGSVLVPTLTAGVSGHAPSLVQSAGIGAAAVGILAITWPKTGTEGGVALSRRALTLAGLAALASGVTFTVLLIAAHSGPEESVGITFLSRAAALGACGLVVLVARAPMLGVQGLARPGLAAGTLDAVGALLFLLASSMGNLAVVAVLVSLYAIVTVLLAQVVLREHLATHQALGVVAAFVGVGLMSWV